MLQKRISSTGKYSLEITQSKIRTCLTIVFIIFVSVWALHTSQSKFLRLYVLTHGSTSTMNKAITQRLDWDKENLPQFCKSLIKHPQPYSKNCSGPPLLSGHPKCDPKRPKMFSQYGEDYYLYTRHFIHQKTPGFYLDIATNNPISISNTYFFDRCLGWKGICFEADPIHYERIHRERSCALVPTCVSDVDKSVVEFVFSGASSGIISTHRQRGNTFEGKRVETKSCVTVKTQFERFGQHPVDFFSLDVEGAELNVLKGIDWEKTVIKMIEVEITPLTEDPIDKLLRKQGFAKFDTMKSVNGLPGFSIYKTNRLYVHNSVTFGRP